ncbi:FMN reductase [Planosporangium thailandense]|uniref:FMN reductase n=1 Tax=Planosporangium thailandense TaxID=765197 RepID=A0ABX0Y1J8_9ACTN|nr:FMN reductase [Planosporangium thailandense]NJC71300.1 FMN reductase [Planosporangium thailandense]
MKERTLAVVSAGLSQPSSTRLLADQLAAATREEADRLGVRLDTRVVELRDHAHDLTNHLLTGFPSEPLGQVIESVAAADALIAVTPIFNASYSGLFKTFFDVLGDAALVDKPVLIGATGGTARHSLALEHALRPMFAYLRAVVVPTSVFAATDDWGAAAAEGPLRNRIRRAAGELAVQVSLREPAVAPDPFALSTSFEDLLSGD